MTDKLKCPFCGAELEQFQGYARCNTEDCVAGFDPMPNQVWQALIDGKKAQDALVEIKSILESARYADTLNFNLDNADGRQIYEIITSITKQDNK